MEKKNCNPDTSFVNPYIESMSGHIISKQCHFSQLSLQMKMQCTEWQIQLYILLNQFTEAVCYMSIL